LAREARTRATGNDEPKMTNVHLNLPFAFVLSGLAFPRMIRGKIAGPASHP
jgi:hypothetical protein